MAYFERYYHSYCNRYGKTCRVSVLEDSFDGEAIELEAQPDPIKIKYSSVSGFKFSPIRASNATFYMTFGTSNLVDFEEFWTADEKQFKLEHRVDNVLEWVGYIIPNGFSYELRGGVYYAEIIASDGLTTLENIPFNLNGDNYGILTDLVYNDGFLFPFVLIATEILRKLELDLNLWTCVDVYEQSMTKTGDTRNADPLATSFVNVKTYINKTERKDIPYWKDVNQVMNCKEVLENLCYLFAAKVYQNKGVWRIKRVNADADYGTGDTQRYWRKYNTAAVYLSRETINNIINIPCSTIEAAMIGDDHIMSMDEVYAAVRINYDYEFVREGDEPVSLITNPLMKNFPTTSQLTTPEGWVRWRSGNKWYPKLKPYTMTSQDILDTGGIETAIEMGTQATGQNSGTLDPNAAIWASLRWNTPVEAEKGADLFFSFWSKYRYTAPDNRVNYYPVFKLVLVTDDKTYYLRNNNQLIGDYYELKYDWTEQESFFFFNAQNAKNYVSSEMRDNKWYKFEVQLEKLPDAGMLTFDIHGLAANEGRDSSNFPAFTVWHLIDGVLTRRKYLKTVRGGWEDYGGVIPRLRLTDVKLGRIPNESELPSEQDYVYFNTTGEYSLRPEPIKILNGDTLDENHVSGIVVPTNVSGLKNFWDTIDGQYGLSSLGLIQAKSIMNLYYKPFRVLEGTIMAEGLDFDKKITFDAIPDVEFVIQSGTFNPNRNYIENGVFVEINNDPLPAGGQESGNDLVPILGYNGINRCRKDMDGLNTGIIEYQYTDENPASPTYRQTSWIFGTVPDLVSCPIGEPSPYYWGCEPADYDEENFIDFPYTIEKETPKSVQVPYTNSGGKYVFFLHLASLGLVEKVSTETQENIISDFQYLADITIGGYLYKVLRQNYITADFNGLNIIYTFNQNQKNFPSPIGVSTTYYRLTDCATGVKKRYTTIAPSFANQTYIDYVSYPPRFFTWDGADFNITSTTPPVGFLSNLQKITGETGCP